MTEASAKQATALLKGVSRSFYLTLRVLPGKVRPQIGIAYLLARTTDTIADTELVPVEERLGALHALRERILGRRTAPVSFGKLVEGQSSPAERVLLERCEESVASLNGLTAEDLQLVREVLGTIISGQELDLGRFNSASGGTMAALRTDQELEDYIYRVAGCVGEFWTRICRARLFPHASLDDEFLLTSGVQFGKGLQLVNVLRDLPRDLRRHRCYLPADGLSDLELKPEDLLDPVQEPRLRPLFDAYVDRADTYLRAGWAYTNALPRRQVRVRLACAWPILIGMDTLTLLRRGKVLNPSTRIRVERGKLRRWMWRSIWLYPRADAWQRMVPPAPESPAEHGKPVASKGFLP
jgi:farnesyl-diphosphate farnesyltransferase